MSEVGVCMLIYLATNILLIVARAGASARMQAMEENATPVPRPPVQGARYRWMEAEWRMQMEAGRCI